MKKYELGNKTEAIVLSAYLSAGFIASIPFGTGASYDFVVDSGSRLYKIQVKTAWTVKGIIKYNCLRRQPGDKSHRPYINGETDYFAVYYPTTETLYGIPAENHLAHGWLRLEPVKNGQSKLVRWASDYSWEKHLTELKNEYARQELNLRPFGSEPNTLSPELRARKEIIAQI